jgi:hypothetical protein
MTNANATFSRLRGKIVTDTDAQTFARVEAYTQTAVFLLNLRTQKQIELNRAQFIKWMNIGALHLINNY